MTLKYWKCNKIKILYRIYIISIFLAIAVPLCTSAQVMSNDVEIDEEIFVYKVKIIDEFIERFNDHEHSFIRKQLSKKNKDHILTRQKLLISLVNWDNHDIAVKDGKEFILQVADTSAPLLLNFNDSTWYASIKCVFETPEKKKVELPIFLHIKTHENGGANWMIAGIADDTVLTNEEVAKDATTANKSEHKKKYIPSSSYAIDFLTLHRVFTDSMNETDYFDEELLLTDKAKQLISLVKNKKLVFQYATDIKFHFFQIPGWIFVVENIDRKSKNSGWLINKLQRAGDLEKEVARKKLLQLTHM